MDLGRIKKNTRVDANGCWIWQKSVSSSGYGQLTENRIYWNSHVYAYSCVNGVPPKGIHVRHSCHNRKCCNPEHLSIGSARDNYYDSFEKHSKAHRKKRYPWNINGVRYATFREAQESTGISSTALSKFNTNGLFDVDAYRKSCRIARKIPKV